MSYAVIKTGGKQYRVAAGDVINVEKIEGEVGSSTTFSEVLFMGEGEQIKLGEAVANASVTAEVMSQFKDKKVIAFKYRRRKGYHRTVGHRRKLTRIKITGINA